jgi:hypothetical protein
MPYAVTTLHHVSLTLYHFKSTTTYHISAQMEAPCPFPYSNVQPFPHNLRRRILRHLEVIGAGHDRRQIIVGPTTVATDYG